MGPAELAAELAAAVKEGRVRSKSELQAAKLALARERGVAALVTDSAVLAALGPAEREAFAPWLRTKPSRTLSGVAIVTVQSSPHACPHGTCTYCPGGPRMGTAQAYTGQEPAARRAARHGFDPYRQVLARLAQLSATGHAVDKVDLVVQGGTFPARDLDYQQWFLQRCYEALNDGPAFAASLFGAGTAGTPRREAPATLDAAKRRNESAPSRCIGLTLETRPDWCGPEHVDAMLELGTTRVEIGVQSLDDAVHRATKRFQTTQQVLTATRAAKDAGLKVCYHMMPGLPGTSPGQDIDGFRRLFAEEGFRPDMLKIYPTLVVAGTELYAHWLRGAYEPLDTAEAARVVGESKALLPPWVRVQRVERDIPTPMIQHGVPHTNLRQLAKRHLRQTYRRDCVCVRCREVGHRLQEREADPESLAPEPQPDRVELREMRYRASGGTESFLSFEDPGGTLYAYLRLRLLEASWRPELRGPCAVVRELKVPGSVVPLGRDPSAQQFQHRGRGRELMAEAGRLAREEFGLDALFVLAGPGVKPYYRRLGFRDAGPYLRQSLRRARGFRQP